MRAAPWGGDAEISSDSLIFFSNFQVAGVHVLVRG